MNLFRNSLVSSLRALGLRRRGDIGFDLKRWKFFSVYNSMKYNESNREWTSNNLYDLSEIKNMQKTKSERPKRDINFDEDEDDSFDDETPYKATDEMEGIDDGVESINNLELGPTSRGKSRLLPLDTLETRNEARVNQISSSLLLRCFLTEETNSFIRIDGESDILDLTGRGLEPECLFVYDESLVEELHDSLLKFPIYVVQYNYLVKPLSLVGIFKHDDMRHLAEAIKPKIPITVICDSITHSSIVGKIWNMAAGMGCERIIIIKETGKFFSQRSFTGIECSYIKTDFVSSLQNAINLIDPTYKFLVFTMDRALEQLKLDDSDFHVFGSEDSWETGNVVLIISGRDNLDPEVEFGSTYNVKFIKFDSGNGGLLSFRSCCALYELLREYRAKNLRENKKIKKSTQRKTKTQKIEA